MASISLPAAVVLETPWVTAAAGGGGGFGGALVELAAAMVAHPALGRAYGGNVTLAMYAASTYGALVNGSWNGAVGEVARGTAALGIGVLSITSARLEAVDYLTPFTGSGQAWIVRSDASESVQARLWGWLRPFSASSWAVILATMIVSGVVMALFDRVSPYGFRRLGVSVAPLSLSLSLPSRHTREKAPPRPPHLAGDDGAARGPELPRGHLLGDPQPVWVGGPAR